MTKQPKLLLRESCVRDLTRQWQPGTFIEMGAGTGHMASIFRARGFHGACHDIGASNRDLMRTRFAGANAHVAVVDELTQLQPESFDYLLAFEVLEHIEDDHAALATWVNYLKPGGRLIATVPAHQRKFGPSDRMVGHVRRYERAQLRALLEGTGLQATRLVNYGFPITELTRTVSNRLIATEQMRGDLDQVQKSVLSAQSKPAVINQVLSHVSARAVTPFCTMQRWFYPWDWGDGLAATAVKPKSQATLSG